LVCPRHSHRQNLAVGGHVDGGVALESIFAPPEDSGSLILSIEIDTTSSIKWDISKRTGLVPTPRKHGQRHGNRDINSNLSHVDLPLEFPSGCTGLSEDGGAVTILILVDDLDGLVKSLGLEDDEHGSEDLFMVAFHRGVGLDDGRSNEVPVWISSYLDVTSIQEDLSTLRLSGAN